MPSDQDKAGPRTDAGGTQQRGHAVETLILPTEKLQKPKDEPFRTGGGGLIGVAMLIAMLAVAFIVLLLYVGR